MVRKQSSGQFGPWCVWCPWGSRPRLDGALWPWSMILMTYLVDISNIVSIQIFSNLALFPSTFNIVADMTNALSTQRWTQSGSKPHNYNTFNTSMWKGKLKQRVQDLRLR